jgi:hypothetical protein
MAVFIELTAQDRARKRGPLSLTSIPSKSSIRGSMAR